MEYPDYEERLAETLAKLSALIRQLMRARAANDALAVQLEQVSICSMLGCLLSTRLERSVNWDSSERWIDSAVGARIEIKPPDEITVRARMVWGLTADAGGRQWAEPFEAHVRLASADGEIHAYRLKFSDHEELEQKRMTTAFFATLADPAGKVIFHPFLPDYGKEPRNFELPWINRSDDGIEWAHKFKMNDEPIV